MTIENSLLPYLPARLAEGLASIGGRRLQRRRYPRDLDRQVDEILARDGWSAERWADWQATKLAAILEEARRHVSHYERTWQGSSGDPQRLSDWPVLDKRSLRDAPDSFLSDRFRRRELIDVHSSGSTGTPLLLRRSIAGEQAWYSIYEARTRRWFGLNHQDRWAIFGGRIIAQATRTKPPFWLHNRGMRQLYCSSYHLGPANAASYAQALVRFQPRYIVGYPSALYSLATFAIDQALPLPEVTVVITNGEPLSEAQRAAIGQAFGSAVRSTWGMAEMVSAASECEHGRLHLWPDVGIIEVLDPTRDSSLPTGATGRLVCTGLLDPAMPLVRYEVGDLGASSEETSCPCGRNLPIMAGLVGRLDDIVRTPDGREIGRFDPIFKGDFPIREAQIRQEDLETLVVRVVAGPAFDQDAETRLLEAMRRRVGDMTIHIDRVDSIERGPNGKLRTVVSNLS